MTEPIRNEPATEGIKVLLVVAHPDDEYYCAATIYRLAHERGAAVDQLVITNGEGGYRYAALAERIYGHALTHEEIGRARLPAIRKEETLRAGRILGIRNHYFLDQRDIPFTRDLRASTEQVWDRPLVEQQLDGLLETGGYDFLFTVLPTEHTHEHHRAATLLALERVVRMKGRSRPVVLGCAYRSSRDRTKRLFSMLPGYPITRVRYREPVFSFDRRHKFGFDAALDYAIVVHWMMAEYKSQGYFQAAYYGRHDREDFWYFASNGAGGLASARSLFEILRPTVRSEQERVRPEAGGLRRKYRQPPRPMVMNYTERAALRFG